MRMLFAMTGFAAAFLVSTAHGGIGPPIPKPAAVAMTADVTVIGKVTEIEKETVEAPPYFGFGKDAKVRHTIAVIKIDDTLIGAKGLTQVRVGVTDNPFPKGNSGPPLGGSSPAAIKLAVGQTGCFFLSKHHSADFYVLMLLGPILKSDADYDKVMAEIKIVAKTIADPVSVLKSKVQSERFLAANTMLARAPRITAEGAKDPLLEDMTPEENKLVLEILQEMPWTFERNAPPRNPRQERLLSSYILRTNLFPYVDPTKYGFEYPRSPPTKRGESPRDMTKEADRASAHFLRDNMDRIKLQKHVRPK